MGDRGRFGPAVRRRCGSLLGGRSVWNYELEVGGGELSDDAAPAFEGMRLERRDGTTILVGHVRDQAALQGVLTRISDLGLALLSAKSREELTIVDAPGLNATRQNCPSASLTSLQRTVSA